MTSPYTVGKPIEMQIGHILEHSLYSETGLKTDKIYPSSSSICDRRSVAMTLLPESAKATQSVVNQMYFKIGSAIEDVVVRALNAGGILVDREIVVKRDWKDAHVSGRIDAVIKLDEMLYPVEIKSCGSTLPKKPKTHHQSQLMTYMVSTGMHVGFLIYVSRTVADWRQNLKYKVFKVEMSPEKLDSYASYLATVLVYVNEKTLPVIPFEDSENCKYCPIFDYCWNKKDQYEMAGYEVDPAGIDDLASIIGVLKDRIIERQPDYFEETKNSLYGESHF